MSEENPLPPENRDLEDELRRLVPSKLKADFISELARDQARIASSPIPEPRRSKWLILALATCAIVFCGTTFHRIRNASQPVGVVTSEAPVSARPASANKFVPISSDGYLINASSGGIIDSGDGPRQQFELNYEDIDYWHNPETGTHIRIFSPRREMITIPVQTD